MLKHSDDAAFEAAYQLMLQNQVKSSKGERKRRLSNGLGFAEKKFLSLVWYPAFNHFDGLYPEYEVRDFKDGTRCIDFAFMKNSWKVCIEIDPFGTHYRGVNRWQFSDHLIRHRQGYLFPANPAGRRCRRYRLNPNHLHNRGEP